MDNNKPTSREFQGDRYELLIIKSSALKRRKESGFFNDHDRKLNWCGWQYMGWVTVLGEDNSIDILKILTCECVKLNVEKFKGGKNA